MVSADARKEGSAKLRFGKQEANDRLNLSEILRAAPGASPFVYMVSPFPKVLSEAEADSEEMRYLYCSERRQFQILEGFSNFFKWMGSGVFVSIIHSDNCPNEMSNVSFSWPFGLEDFRDVIKRFLMELELPNVFFPERQAFVVFNYDMTAIIYSVSPLVDRPICPDIFCVQLAPDEN